MKGERIMKYEAPAVVAQNNATGSYAMGCPTRYNGGFCISACEIRK